MYKIGIGYTTMKLQNKFVIIKKIAKHGSQAIIVIPRILEEILRPGTVAEVSIRILQESKQIEEVKQ